MLANVTAASTLEEEMLYGTVLPDADLGIYKEHKLSKEGTAIAENKFKQHGWDARFDEAYLKNSDRGGGTALVAKMWSGIRPIATIYCPGVDMDILHGRYSQGVVAANGGCLLCSVYGFSGLSVARQCELWHAVAAQIRLVGLPFILGGDWQVLPREMEAAGFPELVGGVIFAPTTPTNLVTLRTIDYDVVARELADNTLDVTTILGARFSPHAPVRLRLRAARSGGVVTRLRQPRILRAGPQPKSPWRLTASIGGSGIVSNSMKLNPRPTLMI